MGEITLSKGLLILVVVFNGYWISRACLKSLLKQTKVPRHIVLVDNGSSGKTKDWLASLRHPDVTVVRSEINLGAPGGRNLGLKSVDLSQYDMVAFLDNDVIVSRGWYIPLVWHLQNMPDVGLVGDRGFTLAALTGEFYEFARLENPRGYCHALTGYCMMARAEAASAVGFFDERLGLYWCEDDDYSIRYLLAGWKVYRVRNVLVKHVKSMHSSRQIKEEKRKIGEKNRKYLAKKWIELKVPQLLGLDSTVGRQG